MNVKLSLYQLIMLYLCYLYILIAFTNVLNEHLFKYFQLLFTFLFVLIISDVLLNFLYYYFALIY